MGGGATILLKRELRLTAETWSGNDSALADCLVSPRYT